MGLDPVTLGLGLGLAAVTTGVQVASGMEQNAAIEEANRRNAEIAAASAAANKAVADQKYRDQRSRVARQYDIFSGTLRASASDRGAQGSSNQAALERNLLESALRENANAGINLSLQKQAIDTGSVPNFQPTKSIFGDAIMGGLSGLQLGLNLGTSFKAASTAQANQAIIKSSGTLNLPTLPTATGLPFSLEDIQF